MSRCVIFSGHPDNSYISAPGFVRKSVAIPTSVQVGAWPEDINKILIVDQGAFSISIELTPEEAEIIGKALLDKGGSNANA